MTGSPRVPALSPGDRAPNLTLPDLAGRTRRLYQEVSGGLIVVVTVPDPLTGRGRSVLEELSRRAATLARLGAHCILLTRRPPELAAPLAAQVWIDPYGDAMALFRPSLATGGQASASAAVLDANQRLVALYTTEETADAVDAAVRLAETLAAGMAQEPRDLDRTAPVLVVPRLLPPELCDRLSAIGTDRPVQDPDLKRATAVCLGARLGNEIRRAFQFRPQLRFEPFRVVAAGAEAAARRGASVDQPRHRFVALVGLATDEAGAGVVLPEFGPHVYRLRQGVAVAFSCELLYRTVLVPPGGTAPVLATVLAEPA